jgi:hypothetical protein
MLLTYFLNDFEMGPGAPTTATTTTTTTTIIIIIIIIVCRYISLQDLLICVTLIFAYVRFFGQTLMSTRSFITSKYFAIYNL